MAEAAPASAPADAPTEAQAAAPAAEAPAAAAATTAAAPAATAGGATPAPVTGGPPVGVYGDGPPGGKPSSPSGGKTMQFASLYVGDLHPDVGEAMLYEAFQLAGNVASCRVCRDSVTRRSLGYGYVNYYSVADAERALDTLNYMAIKGKPCRIMWSQRDPTSRRNLASNVFVKGLDPSIDNKALHDTFSIFGNILSCKVATDLAGKSKGYGFVHYEAEEAAKQAIAKVNGMRIGESTSTVFVGPFLKREELEEKSLDNYTNLYVKHMPPSWDEEKLRSVFGEFGELVSVWATCTDEGKRFALINYKESKAAKEAVKALHKKDMRPEVGAASEAPPAPAPAAEEEGSAAAPAAAEGSAAATEEKKPAESQEEGPGPTKEEKDDAKHRTEEAHDEEDHPLYLLYVQRAQTRAERKLALDEERRKRKGGGKGAPATGKSPPGARLCVKNLSEKATEQSLRELFEPFGKITSVTVRTDEEGKCKGTAFVAFATVEEATQATKELNSKVVDEKPLDVSVVEGRRRRGDDEGGEEEEGEGWKGRKGEGKGKGKGKKGGKDADAGKGKGKGFGKGKGKDGGPGFLPFPGPPPIRGPIPGVPPVPYAFPPRPVGPPGAPPPPYPQAGYAMPGYPGMPGAPIPGYPGMIRAPAYPLPPAMAGGMPFGAQRPPVPMVPYGAQGMPPNMGPAGALRAPVPMPMMPMPGMPPTPITREALSTMVPQQQKQALGERLFAQIQRHRPQLAGKLTGMMLELDNNEILGLLASEQKLVTKITEAVSVLEKK